MDPQSREGKPRNPFGVKLEPVPDDEEVKAFAKTVNPAGDANDANAAMWVDSVTPAKGNGLDGDWSGRWKYYNKENWVLQTEPTRIVSQGNLTYILFTYHEGGYLIVATREGKDRLVGRFMSVSSPSDTGPYVGLIVDNERIDGEWKGPAGAGRWDFRRKLK